MIFHQIFSIFNSFVKYHLCSDIEQGNAGERVMLRGQCFLREEFGLLLCILEIIWHQRDFRIWNDIFQLIWATITIIVFKKNY